MGDRAQVAIKQDFEDADPVFLYGHWIGRGIYTALQAALNDFPGRARDASYLARIIFDRMVGDDQGNETGFGIDTREHGDIEHVIPLVDCEEGIIYFDKFEFNGGEDFPNAMTFEQFAACDLSSFYANY